MCWILYVHIGVAFSIWKYETQVMINQMVGIKLVMGIL